MGPRRPIYSSGEVSVFVVLVWRLSLDLCEKSRFGNSCKNLAEGAFEALADLVGPDVKKLQEATDPENVAAELRDLLEANACKLVDGGYVSPDGELAAYRVSNLVERYSGPYDVQGAALGVSQLTGASLAEVRASFEAQRQAGVDAHAAIEEYFRRCLEGTWPFELLPLPSSAETEYAHEVAAAAEVIQFLLDEGCVLVAVEVALMYGRVGGTFDAVVLTPSGRCILIDWKRRAKLETSLHSRKGLVPTAARRESLASDGFHIGDWATPLAHLTKGDETALKMSMYARLFDLATKQYAPVDALLIVNISPSPTGTALRHNTHVSLDLSLSSLAGGGLKRRRLEVPRVIGSLALSSSPDYVTVWQPQLLQSEAVYVLESAREMLTVLPAESVPLAHCSSMLALAGGLGLGASHVEGSSRMLRVAPFYDDEIELFETQRAACVAARKASSSTSAAVEDEDAELLTSSRDRATKLAAQLAELNNQGVASTEVVVHPTAEQVNALQRGVELVERLHIAAGWSSKAAAQFTVKVKAGCKPPSLLPLTERLLKLKHEALGKVLFDSLDGAKATEYATIESVIKLSVELLKQENLSYVDLKTWTPVTANPSIHIESQSGINPQENLCSKMAAKYLGLKNSSGMLPFVDACSWGKLRGQCGDREPPPEDVRDLAVDFAALVIVAMTMDGVWLFGSCGAEYVELLEPRLRAITCVLDYDVQVTLTDIEAGFNYTAFTGRPIPPPHTLGGLAGRGLKSIKVECEGDVYTSNWLPRGSRGAGTRHDIGQLARLCMAVHETRADQFILIIGSGTDNFGSFDLNLLRHERFRAALIVAGQDGLPPCDLASFVLSPAQLGSLRSKAVQGGADVELLGSYSKEELDAFARRGGAIMGSSPKKGNGKLIKLCTACGAKDFDVKNLGSGTAGMYRYECSKCGQKWQEMPQRASV